MKIRQPASAALLLTLVLVARVAAQPPIPAAPVVAPPLPTGVVTSPAAVAPATPVAPGQVPTIWNKLGITKAGCKECRARCCQSPLGQLLNSMTMPLSFATGGLIPPLCPPGPTPEDLAKLTAPDANASPAEVAAAKIKADEAKAAARRAAVRYLGTVDCHYFPEAEGALIAGLRSDRNECVRYEAALALGKGCCCTAKTIAALTLVVNGLDTDGNPSETSERVKGAAMCALQQCLSRPGERRTEPPTQPERPPEPPESPPDPKLNTGDVQQASFVLKAQTRPVLSREQLIQEAARTMAENVSLPAPNAAPPTGRRSVFGVLEHATTPTRAPLAELGFDEAALSAPPPPPAPRLLPPVTAEPVPPAVQVPVHPPVQVPVQPPVQMPVQPPVQVPVQPAYQAVPPLPQITQPEPGVLSPAATVLQPN